MRPWRAGTWAVHVAGLIWYSFLVVQIFNDLQQTRPKCIFEHDKRHFMARSPCASLDAYPRPLPRAVYPQCPRLLPRHLFHPSSSAFVIFCSPAPPRITLCHATKTMFLLNHCNRAFFPLSFRVDPSQAQGRGSSGALPRSGYRKCSRA